MSKEAMKLALEALENSGTDMHDIAQYQFEIRAIKALEEALAKQEQGEPVAWFRNEDIFGDQEMEPIFYATKAWDDCLPLYTTPQQRKPLTDEQINAISDEYLVDYRIPAGCALNFARDVEAAHGIKE